MILSGYSSRIFEMRSVPIPDPVPPPSEWVSWKPCRQSHDSDSLRTTSNTESTSSAPKNLNSIVDYNVLKGKILKFFNNFSNY